mgnify:FL=1
MTNGGKIGLVDMSRLVVVCEQVIPSGVIVYEKSSTTEWVS